MIKRLIAHVAGKAASRQLNHFLQATQHVERVQAGLLCRQMRLLAGSRFADDYRLAGIDSYAEFVKRVPVQRYDGFAPYIERLKAGDPSALFSSREKLLMFALTSGTTGTAKYIPVTATSVADLKRGWNIFGVRALLDHPKAFFRDIVQITSNPREHRTPGGAWAGAVTGLLAETQKWIVRKHYVTPLCVAHISDPVAKSYAVVRSAITADVSFTNTANPSTMLRLATVMAEHSEQLIADVHNGTLTAAGEIPPTVLAELKKRLRPNPSRAKQLRAIADRVGRLLPKDVWQLEFLANWTGGTLRLYLERYPEFFGDTPVRDIGLLASEGRFSIPIDDATPAGIVEFTGNLIEFIPQAEYGSPNPTTIPMHAAKVGEKYFLVFSNATGLTRYDIGDLVEVVDFYNGAPMIAFLNKGSHISSLTGEKITEHQAVETMKRLAAERHHHIENFVLCPHWAETPFYALTLERSDAIDAATLADRYDAILQSLNIEYHEKRRTLRLAPMKLQTVPDGFFAGEDLKRLAHAGRSEQYKRKFLLTSVDADRDLPIDRPA
jgi:hypothetical protein